jgi:hypothetical protein
MTIKNVFWIRRFPLSVLGLAFLSLAWSKAFNRLLAGFDKISHISIPGGLLVVLMGFNPGQNSLRSFFGLLRINGK